MSQVTAVPAIDQPDKLERFQDALYLASNAFLNLEHLFRILRDGIEGCGAIDRERVGALVQIGIDLTHFQGELTGQTADAFFEVRRG